VPAKRNKLIFYLCHTITYWIKRYIFKPENKKLINNNNNFFYLARKSNNIEMNNTIVIFDEAHNVVIKNIQ